MNASDVLERLSAEYAEVPAPTPSRELAARLDDGWIGTTGDERRAAVVVPFVPRPRLRMRYLVAAMLATFVATSGLAAAGVLPDALQRRVASVVSHVGIDLPTPDDPSSPAPADGRPGGPPPGSGRSSTSTTAVDGPAGRATEPGSGAGSSSGTAANGRATPSTTLPGPLGNVGGATTVPPTTLPLDPDAPPTTAPPVTLPPLTLPPLTLPPITLPQVTLPPLTLPPLTLPPILGL